MSQWTELGKRIGGKVARDEYPSLRKGAQGSDWIMSKLQPYGVVTIFQHDDKTFRAKAKLFMHGLSAEVASDFNHPTMHDALRELYDRVMDVVVQKEAPK